MAKMKKNTPERFTALSNEIVRDDRLSWKARGIFLYLFSQSENWEFYEIEVAKHSTDGRDSLRSGLKELEKYGYMKRERIRNEKGQLMSSDWLLSDIPMQIEPMLEYPTQVDATLSNTNKRNTNTSNTNNNYNDIFSASENISNAPQSETESVSKSDLKKQQKAEEQKQLETNFETIWKKYPKKAGKPMALKAFLKAVKSGVEIDLISTKIDEYNQQIKLRGTEKQWIKNGSTWFNQQGWLDEYDLQPVKQQMPFNRYGREKRQAVVPKFVRDQNKDI